MKTIIFLILLFSISFSFAGAFADIDYDRNDAMCFAIFIMAAEQERTKNLEFPQLAPSTYYYSLAYIIGWKQDEMNVYAPTYNSRVTEYKNNMDTATALLHWNRCELRVRNIWPEFYASK